MRTTGRSRAAGVVLLLVAAVSSGCEAQTSGLTQDGLEAMIDSLLPGIAEASGLAVREPVRFALQSRAEASSFIERQLDEEFGSGELAASERAYKAFGLLPDTLDLRALMLELLTEQVVGYYDPETDRLYVVEGAPAATAGPVVAHELVHALQDQHMNLDSLVKAERGNDRQMAAQAAAEGQAMLVMLGLQAAETTGRPIDLGALPDLGPMLRPALDAENSQFPVFQRSPRLIRETLIFPYIAGASFVQALIRHQPGSATPVPFGDLLPQSTEQVLDPARAFLGERDHPTELELGPAPDGWTVLHENTLGQFELSLLMRERLGSDADAATGWDGDRYALLDGLAGARALVWYTVWDDAAAADRFVQRYRGWSESPGAAATADGGALGPGSIERYDFDGRPVVRVVEVGPGIEPSDIRSPRLESLEERER